MVPRDLVFEVSARTRADGAIEGGFDAAEVQAIAAELRVLDIAAVAVVLLNSYRHPELEALVAAELRRAIPGAFVTASARLWPEMREYERAMVASLNAYIHPQLDRYFTRLSERLQAIAIAAPIFITANNGGTIGLETARGRPIDTVLSGPASGVVASCAIANASGCDHFVSVDMGGTSSDMSLTVGGRPEYSTQSMVGEFPLILPVVNVSAIGAGGGSIVWIDAHGILKVGPRSAGADPGPVCYGRGGGEVAITDCYLALGVIRPDGFLGGRMHLDRVAADAALASLGRKLGFAGADAAARTAEAALKVATAKMTTELHRGFAQRGHDPRDFALVALGGAGPTQANLLADEVRMPVILVPVSPGTLCAMGAVTSELKRDFVRGLRELLEPSRAERLRAAIRDMRGEAREWLETERLALGSAIKAAWTGDMRYPQEGAGLPTPLSDDLIDRADIPGMIAAFHAEHERVYGFRDERSGVELLTLHVQVAGEAPEVGKALTGRRTAPAPVGATRSVFMGGRWRAVPVRPRDALSPGDEIGGPALVEQEDTTTWIVDGWRATVEASGVLRIERRAP